MTIKPVTGRAFKPFGRVIKGYYLRSLIEEMEKTECPSDKVVYEPSVRSLETLKINRQFSEEAYGGMPIQIGYCNGTNTKLNCVEYHRDSEINIGAQDFILLVARQQDITADFTLNTDKVEAFLAPAGAVVEVYATTLHYAPCDAAKGAGFRVAVVLPKDTNTDAPVLSDPQGEDRLLRARNKWLIAHPDAAEAQDGAHIGLIGENIDIALD